VQDDGDRIRESLLKRGYLDVEVGADLQGTLAHFDVRAGRAYVTRVSGLADPPDLSGVLRKSLYEEEALEKGRAELLETLFAKGHWRASVSATANDEGETRVLHFAVEPGPLLKLGGVTFPGAVALSQHQLLSAAGGPGALVRAPQQARAADPQGIRGDPLPGGACPAAARERAWRRARDRGRGGRRPAVAGQRGRLRGPEPSGVELRALSRLQPGMPYEEERALLSVDAIRDDYYRNGWANARVHASHEDRPDGISLTYHVSEGRRLTVGRIEITGLRGVRESFVRGNVDLKPGDPVDPARLGRIERRLLALTVFSRVSSRFSDEDPSQVTIEVQERARFGAGYDVRYSNVEKLAGVLDGELRNVFGRGVGLGARYQGSQTIDKLRGTLFVPSFPWKGDLQASVFRDREEDFGEGETDVTRLQRGFQLQESIQSRPERRSCSAIAIPARRSRRRCCPSPACRAWRR
jgi:outer membrane protein assembly factor BamA